jgi:WD40 repeat protein
VPRWIQRLPNVQKDWSVLLQTLKGHSRDVSSVAFSLDGKLLASSDKTVKLWNAGTGAALQTLEVDAFVQTFLFSDDRMFLETDRGLLRTTFNSPRAVPFDGTSQAVYL